MLVCQASYVIFKKDFKLLNSSLPEMLCFVLSYTGTDTDLAEHF